MYSINKKKKKGHVVTGINRIFVLNHCLPFHVKCCLMRSSGLVVMKQLTRFGTIFPALVGNVLWTIVFRLQYLSNKFIMLVLQEMHFRLQCISALYFGIEIGNFNSNTFPVLSIHCIKVANILQLYGFSNTYFIVTYLLSV